MREACGKCFMVVFCVAFFGVVTFMVVTMINAGELPTCGCPPGYLEGDRCTCDASASTPAAGGQMHLRRDGYWDCTFSCPNERNQHGGDCWIGPDLNNEQRQHEKYNKTDCPRPT